MTIAITQERIANAYGQLMSHKEELADASAELENVASALRWARFGAIAEGKITGKNADEREACEWLLLRPLYESEQNVARDVAALRVAVDVAALVVEQLRTELRLLELNAAITPAR